MAQILVFGDSIAYGNWDKGGGWVNRLKKFLAENETSCTIHNLSTSASTSGYIVKTLESDLKKSLNLADESILVFATGINDAQFVKSVKNTRLPPEKFKANIQKIISTAKSISSKVVFIGLTPVDEAKVGQLPIEREAYYKNSNVKEFNEIIKSLCAKHNICFVDVYPIFIKINHTLLLDDGVYPNAAGHEKIFELVKYSMIKNNII